MADGDECGFDTALCLRELARLRYTALPRNREFANGAPEFQDHAVQLVGTFAVACAAVLTER